MGTAVHPVVWHQRVLSRGHHYHGSVYADCHQLLLGRCHGAGDQLSGGQQQRVSLARALSQESEILLADEPVSALDPVTAKEVMDDFKRINEEFNKTILLNIHHVELALEYASRIIAVKKGKIVYDGPSQEVTKEILDEVYRKEA